MEGVAEPFNDQKKKAISGAQTLFKRKKIVSYGVNNPTWALALKGKYEEKEIW